MKSEMLDVAVVPFGRHALARAHAGSPEPRFHVTTVSMDGWPVRSPYGGMSMAPESSIDVETRADIVVVRQAESLDWGNGSPRAVGDASGMCVNDDMSKIHLLIETLEALPEARREEIAETANSRMRFTIRRAKRA